MELRVRRRAGRGEGPNDEVDVPGQSRVEAGDDGSQPALHPVAHDGVAHGAAHHEPCARVAGSLRAVHDEGRAAGPTAGADDAAEVRRAGESGVTREHSTTVALGPVLRPPGSCGPCDDARTGWNARRACAYAGGSRGPCAGDGCSAGTYACSRVLLHYGVAAWWPADLSSRGARPPESGPEVSQRRSSAPRRPFLRRAAPVDDGRPPHGTRPPSTGSNPRRRLDPQPVDDGLPLRCRAGYVRLSRAFPQQVIHHPGVIRWTISVPSGSPF